MGGNKPVVREKFEQQHRDESLLLPLSGIFGYQEFDARMKILKLSTEYYFPDVDLLIRTLNKEINSAVMENYEFEYQSQQQFKKF